MLRSLWSRRDVSRRLSVESLEDRTAPAVLFGNASSLTTSDNSGPVIANSHVELIFWGSAYSNTTNPPTPSQSSVQGAVDSILASHYLSTATQYRSTIGSASRVGSIAITTSSPNASFTNADVDSFLRTNINNGTLPSPASDSNLLYMVIPQPGSTDPTEGLGGEHTYDYNSSNVKFHYGWVINDGALDTVTNVFSHELVESVTDPEGTAIQVNPRNSSSWNEVADGNAENGQFWYRLGGYKVQSYLSVNNAAYAVNTNQTQNFWVDGTGLLTIKGDQLLNKNDQISVGLTTAGGVYATLNGETVTFDPGQITGVKVQGLTGDDTLTLDTSHGLPLFSGGLTFDGGAGTNTLALVGISPYTNETETPTGSASGSITFDANGALTYSNVATINDTATIGGLAIYKGTSAAETITVNDGGVVNSVQTTHLVSNSGTFATVYFACKPSVKIAGAGGVDTITINNPNPAIGMNSMTVTTGGAAGVTLNVKAIAVTTNYIGGANASINVGKAGSMQSIKATLNLENPPAFNTIILDDSADTAAQTVTLSPFVNPADSEGTTENWTKVTGLCAYVDINYEDDDSQTVTLKGSQGGGTLNVQHLETTLNFVAGGNTTVNVGYNGSVQGILATLNLENPPAFNSITLDDSADPTARTVTLSSFNPNGADSEGNNDIWGRVRGLSASADINFEYLDTASLTINGGSGGNTFTVNSTTMGMPGTTTINSGSGNDTFTITATGLGSNSINIFNGQAGIDVFNVTGNTPAGVQLTIDGGSGSNTVNGANLLLYSTVAEPNGTLALNDWYAVNLTDPGIQALTRVDYNRDVALTRGDMLGLFSQVEANGPVTSAELQSLQALVANASLLNMPAYVSNLAGKVVNGNTANASYNYLDSNGNVHSMTLGNLAVGSSSAVLTDLVNKWFLGTDVPFAIDGNGYSYSYVSAAGTLFGSSGGPIYQDIGQGYLGDCYYLSSLGEVALYSPQTIQHMFTDNGDGTYTVRFFHQQNGVQNADYVTVNRQLPVWYGDFIFAGSAAGGFQSISNTSNVLWVALAEKAYAQLAAEGWSRPGNTANSYQSIVGGFGKAPMQQVLGEATSQVYPSGGLTTTNISTLIADIQAGDMITIGTYEPDNNTFFSGTNIVEGHEYYVNGYNATTGLFTIINPWGYNLIRNNQPEGTLQLTSNQLITYCYEFDVAAPHVA
jgi:hypothetical protein